MSDLDPTILNTRTTQEYEIDALEPTIDASPPERLACGTTELRADDFQLLRATFDRHLADMRLATQPIVTADGDTWASEVLMRPLDASPFDVIKLAQPHHWFGDLAAVIHELVLKLSPATYFVNVHPSELVSGSILTTPLYKIKDRIVLEVTEHDCDELAEMRKSMTRLSAKGFSLAIDDIKEDRASFERTEGLLSSFAKIDRSWVDKIDQKPARQSALLSFVEYCHQRNVKVVAEGIERQEEFDVLKDLKVDLFQGYFIARPKIVTE